MEKIFEELPPDLLRKQLLGRKQQLEALLENKKSDLGKAVAGKLRITSNKGTVQYYHVTEKAHRAGKYISKKQQALVKALAQKEYDQKLVQELDAQVEVLAKAVETLTQHDCNTVFENLTPHRKALVEPVTLPTAEYASQWLEQDYFRKGFAENAPELYTAKGERVRSKSEVIIADTLGRLGVPYRYEFPLKLRKFTVHPDFYCLNATTRKEFAWEHLGMMDDPEYAVAAVEKLAAYQEAGFFPGKNLIITMETAENPLSSKQVEGVAREFLK